MNLGGRVKARRQILNLTQDEVGRAIGATQQVVEKLESRDSKRSQYAPALAIALNCDLTWLLTGEGDPEISQSRDCGERRGSPGKAGNAVQEAPAQYDAQLFGQLSTMDREMLASFQQLEPADQERIILMMNALLPPRIPMCSPRLRG